MYLVHTKDKTTEFATIDEAKATGLPVFVPLEDVKATCDQRDALLALQQVNADTVTEAIKAKADAKAELAKATAELAKAKEGK